MSLPSDFWGSFSKYRRIEHAQFSETASNLRVASFPFHRTLRYRLFLFYRLAMRLMVVRAAPVAACIFDHDKPASSMDLMAALRSVFSGRPL
jgi:hypothetical protein